MKFAAGFHTKKMRLTFPQWSVKSRASYLSDRRKNMCNFPFNSLNRLNSKCPQCSLYREYACKSQNVRSGDCMSSEKQHVRHLHAAKSWQNVSISPTCLKCRICVLLYVTWRHTHFGTWTGGAGDGRRALHLTDEACVFELLPPSVGAEPYLGEV